MEQLLLIAILALLLAVLFVLIYALYKVRRFQHLILHSVREQIPTLLIQGLDRQFRQLESLAGLYMELGFRRSLPSTRGWAASPDFLREIALHTLRARPKVIIECGSGVSTVVLARCVQINGAGHVYSLEHTPEFAERTRQELQRHCLRDWATVLNAPLRSYELKGKAWPWYSIEEVPQIGFDMLVIDGPPEETSKLARYPAGPLLCSRLNTGAAVFLDDSDRQQERTILQHWAQEFPELRQEVRNCEKGCVVLWKEAEEGVNSKRARSIMTRGCQVARGA